MNTCIFLNKKSSDFIHIISHKNTEGFLNAKLIS